MKLFWAAYLTAFLFWLQLPLGCLALFLIYNLTGGEWGKATLDVLRTGGRLLRYAPIFALPLVFGAPQIYPWMQPGFALKGGQAIFLTPAFFYVRIALYFGSWIAIATLCERSWDRVRHHRSEPARVQYYSGWGLVGLLFTVSFAAFDGMMSLEPNWHSTVYGLMIITGQGAATLAFLIIYFGLRREKASVMQDLANLNLAYLMCWGYLSFMQYLIIWSGNIPAEVTWYIDRTQGAWLYYPTLLFVLGFVVPFCLLLSRQAKRSRKAMIVMASFVLLSRLLDLQWLVLPALSSNVLASVVAHVLICAVLGLIAAFLFRRELRGLKT